MRGSGPSLWTAQVTFQSPWRSAGWSICRVRRSPLTPCELPLLGQRPLEALQVAGGLVHVGLGHLDVVEPGGGVERDGAGLGALAHDLLVDLGLGGHVDDGVAEELRLAAEAAAGGEAADAVVALLDGVEGGEGVGGGGDAVLGEVAEGGGDLALGADAAAAADRSRGRRRGCGRR